MFAIALKLFFNRNELVTYPEYIKEKEAQITTKAIETSPFSRKTPSYLTFLPIW